MNLVAEKGVRCAGGQAQVGRRKAEQAALFPLSVPADFN
jgi:hypothetical protein